ncbi:MAG TPA: ribonuclease HII [Holophaga sp.]|nr:ribonuclease HII [Holophaga sp.]
MSSRGINLLDWDLGHVPPGIAWGGMDEAGRGAWAGPVVAACAVLDPEAVSKWSHVLRGARDSKQLSPERREALASELKMVLTAWAVAEIDNMAIDRENILEATLDAMRQSVSNLQVMPRMLFVDGDRAPRTGLPERLIVEGDATSCAVAAASILAKTHRDRILRDMAEAYPEYGFERHKGYGTKEHQKALDAFGACPIHRLSYAPVAARTRPSAERYALLQSRLETCDSVAALHAWVAAELRPAYGVLKVEWLEALRGRYAECLAPLALQEREPSA